MIARAMHWKYEDVYNLPQGVYDILVEMLKTEAEQARQNL